MANPDQPNLPGIPSPIRDPRTAPYQRLYSNQFGVSNRNFGRGSLLQAQYDPVNRREKYDRTPLILVTGGPYKDGRIGGLNLHYLTFSEMKVLLNQYKNDRSFSWRKIKGVARYAQAFRSYYWNRLRSRKLLNADYILNLLGNIRDKYLPDDVEKMKEDIRNKLRNKVTQKASDLTTKVPQQQNQPRNPGTIPSQGTIPTQPTIPTK